MLLMDEMERSAAGGSRPGVSHITGRSRHRLVEVILAAVLLIAAGLKAKQVFTSSNQVFPGFIHHQLLILGLIQLEVLLSFWLMLGGFAIGRFLTALACFSIFAMVASYEAVHAVSSCGCFGNVKIPPTVTAVFDGLAVIALWVTRPSQQQTNEPRPSNRLVFCSSLLALLATTIIWRGYLIKGSPAIASATKTNDLVVLEPRSWLHQTFPLLDEIDGDSPLRKGRWLIVMYHYDCETCLRAIPIYRSLADDAADKDVRVAFVQMPPDPPAGQDPVLPSSSYLHLRLRPDHDWFATTPVVVAIENGQVLAADDGEKAVEPPHVAW